MINKLLGQKMILLSWFIKIKNRCLIESQKIFLFFIIFIYRTLKRIYQYLPINLKTKQRIKTKLLKFKLINNYKNCSENIYANDLLQVILQKKISQEICQQYIQNILATSNKVNQNLNYIPRMTAQLDATKLSVQAIAFYLPQFHPISENDAWWGKGFTEWTNVTKAVPQFLGHYQPHLPDELGFYDLRLPQIMHQQIALAKQYGIYGFCFYYYWFNGKRLLEQPLNQFLADNTLDINFCLCWANENWTRRWDGSENQILLAQEHSADDDIAFIDSLVPFFSDRRYIRINNKPLLIVYRATLLPDPAATAQRWRQRIKKHGFDGLYLIAVLSFDVVDPRPLGFDAASEFPPHPTKIYDISDQVEIVNPNYRGHIYSYQSYLDQCNAVVNSEFIKFRGIMPSWDNTARKPDAGHTFIGSTPLLYAQWLRKVCDATLTQPSQQRFFFINAWNEWAEGAHLEPDRKFGYGYLQATAAVLSRYYSDTEAQEFVDQNNLKFKPSNHAVILLHCYYEELIEPIFENYLSLVKNELDLFITINNHANITVLKKIKFLFPNVYFLRYENRGRDIRPFLLALKTIVDMEYLFVCKLHTKKSLYRQDGNRLRENMFKTLVGSPDIVLRIVKAFSDDATLGLLVPKNQILNDKKCFINNSYWLNKLLTHMNCSNMVGNYVEPFPAGSMYWFRTQALTGIDKLVFPEDGFEEEVGQIDGTLAHAIERIIALFIKQRGYKMCAIDL